MRCRTAERLLHLHREGELTAAELRRLDNHLGVCSACSADAIRIRDALRQIDHLREVAPETSDPTRMTESVMTRIRYLEGGVRVRTGHGIRSMAVQGFRHRFQPIVAVAAILLAVGILAEGMMILERITLLEKRLEEHRPAAGITATMDVTAEDFDRGLQRLRDLEAGNIIGRSRASDPDAWIVIRRSDLRRVLDRYGRSDISPETLMRELTRQLPGLPGLGEITIEDGLDRTELQRVLEHSSEIIRVVRGL